MLNSTLPSTTEALQKTLADAVASATNFSHANRDNLNATANDVQQQSEAVARRRARQMAQRSRRRSRSRASTAGNTAVDAALASAQERASAFTSPSAPMLYCRPIIRNPTTTPRICARQPPSSPKKSNARRKPLRAAAAKQTERAESQPPNAHGNRRQARATRRATRNVQQHALTNFQIAGRRRPHPAPQRTSSPLGTLLEEVNGRIRAAFDEARVAKPSTVSTNRSKASFSHSFRKPNEAMQRLDGGRSLLDAALALHQDRIRDSTDESFAEALQQFRSNLGGVEEILRVTTDSVTVARHVRFRDSPRRA